jgi:L-threonylcarbamoyladenylate synthase
MTDILPANDEIALNRAVELLKNGDVVVYRTDTIYGIGASIANEAGIQKIFSVKARSPDKPIILHLKTFEQFQQIVQEVPDSLIQSLKNIWPGPMSGVFFKKEIVPFYVTAGKQTVAVRIPDHKLCLELVNRVGSPLAVTSANISSLKTPNTAPEVAKQLGNRIPLILDGGPSPQQQASTLVDFTGSMPKLLREGAFPLSTLRQLLPNLKTTPS